MTVLKERITSHRRQAMSSARTGVVEHGNTGATETIDWSQGSVHRATANANVTFTFSGLDTDAPAAYGPLVLVVRQDATGSRTITWPASVKWAGGTEPTETTTANREDVFEFFTRDGGTVYYGRTYGLDYTVA